MAKSDSAEVVQGFNENVDDVFKLMNFDRDLLDVAIQSVTALHERLKKIEHFENPQLTAEKTLQQLKGFRTNDSLRPRYATIFNQALVLLVSYFGSSIHDLFVLAASRALSTDEKIGLFDEEFKFSVEQLRDMNFEVRDAVPEMLIASRDISFQDMQSIRRAFDKYMGIAIEKDVDVNNIILGQACRHVIVHAGGLVSEKMIRQVQSATPRAVKTDLALGAQMQFAEDEIFVIAESMKSYVVALAKKIDVKRKVDSD